MCYRLSINITQTAINHCNVVTGNHASPVYEYKLHNKTLFYLFSLKKSCKTSARHTYPPGRSKFEKHRNPL